MTEHEKEEMRTIYRDAKDKKAQIKILADLYLCSNDDVLSVLGLTKASTSKMIAPPTVLPFREKNVRKSYSQAVKKDVVKAVILDKMARQEASERFGIPLSNISKWVSQAKKQRDDFLCEDLPEVIEKVIPPRAEKNTQVVTPPSAEISDAVAALDSAIAVLAETGLFDAKFKASIHDMRVRAEEFKAGMRYMRMGGVSI